VNVGAAADRGASAIAGVGCEAAAAAIATAAVVVEAMSAPAVAVSPAGPGAHAEEDAVIEVARAIVAIGRAGVGGVVVVSPLADRRWAADADEHLGVCCGGRSESHGSDQDREQRRGGEKSFESVHWRGPLWCLEFGRKCVGGGAAGENCQGQALETIRVWESGPDAGRVSPWTFTLLTLRGGDGGV